jgi:carboxyl-terminal processing protease
MLSKRNPVWQVLSALAACAIAFTLESSLVGGHAGESARDSVRLAASPSASWVLAQSRVSLSAPQALYDHAWKIVKDTYYDPRYDGQDWKRWQHKYDGLLKTNDDAHKAIETMLDSLGDPYTRFLNRDAFDEEKSQIEAHLFGVGMQLGMNKEHKIVVIAPIDGTPAYHAGIHPGDEIIEVDSKSVKGQSLDQVVKQIRGEINTHVTITLLRGTEKRKALLTRAEIPIHAIANETLLPGNLGYIRLDSFISQNAGTEMRQALKTFANADGLIVDLRNNPGGLLTNAVDIANMFLEKGIIVSTIDCDGYKTSQIASRTPLTKQPVVILINGGSASASEILSGALRDNGRAKLVGQKSFGKGLVQAINRLEDSSGINVTIARYLTPNDTDINKVGIIPDFDVNLKEEDYKVGKGPWWIDPTFTNFKRSPTDGKDVQLAKAISLLKDEVIASTHSATNGPSSDIEPSRQ